MACPDTAVGTALRPGHRLRPGRRSFGNRQLEQQDFQALRTAVEHEGTGVSGDIEAGETRQPRPVVPECAPRYEEILPAAMRRVWGTQMHVGAQTQQPGGESIVLLGQDQVARCVLPAV